MKKIIDGYSGGSSSVYRGLGKPGSRDGVVSSILASVLLEAVIPRPWL